MAIIIVNWFAKIHTPANRTQDTQWISRGTSKGKAIHPWIPSFEMIPCIGDTKNNRYPEPQNVSLSQRSCQVGTFLCIIHPWFYGKKKRAATAQRTTTRKDVGDKPRFVRALIIVSLNSHSQSVSGRQVHWHHHPKLGNCKLFLFASMKWSLVGLLETICTYAS